MSATPRSSNPFMYPNALWKLWGFFSFVYLGATLALLATFFAFVAIFTKKPFRWHTKWIRLWERNAMRPSAIRFEVEGAENDRPEEPALIISNHQSLLDIPAAFESLGGNVRMVSKRELSWFPLLGWGMLASDFIFINRGDAASRKKAVKQMADAVKRGISIWVAPEGTRSRNGGSMHEFRPGSFAMAIEHQLPIQPVVVVDAFKALPREDWVPRPGSRIRVRILPRVYTNGLTIDDARELAARVQADIRATLVAAGVEQTPVPTSDEKKTRREAPRDA